MSIETGRALTRKEFCERNTIGATTFYKEVNEGRLVAHKIGTKTVVLPENEQAWRSLLPKLLVGETA